MKGVSCSSCRGQITRSRLGTLTHVRAGSRTCLAFTLSHRPILASRSQPDQYRGLCLLAPMISLQKVSRKGLNPYLRPLAALLSRVVPWAPIIATDRTSNSVLQLQWDAGA